VASFETLRNELASYASALKTRPFAVVGTKLDVKGNGKRLDELKAFCKKKRIKFFAISSATRAGLDTLVQHVGERVATLRAACETVS
jgi:GTP-binding protein